MAGAARTMSVARKRTLMVAYMFAMLVIGIVGFTFVKLAWDGKVDWKDKHGKKHGNKDDPAVEMVKRQFQGGGIIGDIPADVSSLQRHICSVHHANT